MGQPRCGGSSVEHFSRTVSPRDWHRVLLLMLTVCFDTAKDDITKGLVLVAGFGGFAGVWTNFDRAWQARLDQDHLVEFHAGDFAHFKNQFESWKGNEPKRRSLLADLMDIIQEHGLRRFGCGVPLDVHNKIDKSIGNFDAYVHAALASVDEFNNYARTIKVDRNVRYVFEKGEREVELRKRFQDEGYTEPDFTWKRPHMDRKGFTHDGFMGLQTAGWLAYEYYLDALRVVLNPTASSYSVEDGRWAFRQFETLTGRIQLAKSPQVSELAMKVRDASKHLRKLRPR
jgi:hypothetical protein